MKNPLGEDKVQGRVRKKTKVKHQAYSKVKGKSTHYIIVHCNIAVTEDFFNTSFNSWRDVWLFDIIVQHATWPSKENYLNISITM
jgi:hypothetical protein